MSRERFGEPQHEHVEPERSDVSIDPIAQLEELVELLSRGLVTRDEFERQKAKVLGA